MRPPDACPYPKPFAADFDGCPAYQARHLQVQDSTGRPLKTIWSCRHLTSRAVDGQPGRFYGACAIGDGSARRSWVQRIGPERIRAIRSLREKVLPFAQAFIEDVVDLTSRSAPETMGQPGNPSRQVQMQALAGHYLAALEAELKNNAELVEAAQMPVPSVMQLADQWAHQVITETSTGRAKVEPFPDELLQGLPDSVRLFYGA